MSDFVEGQKHMAKMILEMLRKRPLDEERGVAENKIQNMIENFNALPDDRPVVGFVRLFRGIPDLERRESCFAGTADEVMKEFAKNNQTPTGPVFTAIPVYR
jgi:hypothetical protein